MTWLLRLYPPAWRRRYAEEVATLLADRPFSLSLAIDLIAGAVDVWLHPSQTLAAAKHFKDAEKETVMSKPVFGFDCTRVLGPAVTRADQRKAVIAMFATTILLTGTWMVVHIKRGDNPVIDSLSMMPWIIGMMVSMRYTYLKDRSAGTQAVIIAGVTFVSAAFLIGAGLIATGL